MYSGVRKLTLFGIILSVFNIIASVLLMLHISSISIQSYVKFYALIFLLTSSVLLLINCCALKSTTQNITLNDETYSSKIIELRKRVEDLEKRINN